MRTRRIGGWCLISAAAVSVVMMAHHPTGMLTGGVGQFVHGGLIIMTLVVAFGFAIFVAERGAGRPALLAGALSYSVALYANIGAGSINGFAAPALAAGSLPIGTDVMRLAWELNQTLATLAVFATCAAFLFWAIVLLMEPGKLARLTGCAGLLAAIVPTALILSGVLRMDVDGAFLVYAIQSAWGMLVGILMLLRAAPEAEVK